MSQEKMKSNELEERLNEISDKQLRVAIDKILNSTEEVEGQTIGCKWLDEVEVPVGKTEIKEGKDGKRFIAIDYSNIQKALKIALIDAFSEQIRVKKIDNFIESVHSFKEQLDELKI